MEREELFGSSPENEFFHKLNKEQIAQYREKLDADRRMQEEKQQKELHWMKCPKCGHDLVEQNLTGVMIDACQTCGGVFLDQGELDLLRKADQNDKFFVNLNDLIFRRKKS
ncbi:MAG: zf-TFIIB domain-containing protein [Oligoflexus sp.]